MFLPWRHRRCLKADSLLSRHLASEPSNRLLVSLSHSRRARASWKIAGCCYHAAVTTIMGLNDAANNAFDNFDASFLGGEKKFHIRQGCGLQGALKARLHRGTSPGTSHGMSRSTNVVLRTVHHLQKIPKKSHGFLRSICTKFR
jgi:hypothetical protein